MTTHAPEAPLEARLLLDRAVMDDPYAFFARLRNEAPVWLVPGSSIVVVSSFDAVCEATNRTSEFSSTMRGVVYRDDNDQPQVMPYGEDFGADVLAIADPPVHSRHRSTVFPELVARRMTGLRSEVEAIADEFVDAAVESGRVEAMAAIANAIPIRVVSRLIGWEDEDPDRLLAAAFDATGIVGATHTRVEIEQLTIRSAEVIDWIYAEIQAAVADGADGILGAMATAISQGQLDELEALAIMATLLSAGGESTTSLLGNAMHILATDHDLQDRLRREPDLITPFIEEVLRVESPFRYHLRHTYTDVELHGVTIPAGSTVLLLWAAANHDPAEYDRADEIVLDRPAARHHLAFGRGIHLCVGAPLARLEADVVLRRLLERSERLDLDPAQSPVREDSLIVRRFARLPLLITPR